MKVYLKIGNFIMEQEGNIMKMEILNMKAILKMVNMKEKENYMKVMELLNIQENL